MISRRDTREALLDAGVELFLAGGYDFAGTNAILERAKVPRGSFYHHFGDKQGFALAVAQHYYERHLPMLDSILADEQHPPLARLRIYFESLRDHYEAGGWTGGCLLGLLSQELASRDVAAREALAALFRRWRHRVAANLREAQSVSELDPRVDCDELAGFLIDGWEGALIAMKVHGSGAPLDRFIRNVFEELLPGRTPLVKDGAAP